VVTADVLVLGCGWAGITTAYYLLKEGMDVVCVDASTTLGGLLRSEVHGGFVFDIGGSHVIFSSNELTLKEMLGFLNDNVITHQRRSYVRLFERFIPYPLENNLYALPLESRAEALVSFIEFLLEFSTKHELKPRNLREYLISSFSKEISRLYLEPYNEKIWKRPLDDIDVDWLFIPGRLPLPNRKDVVKELYWPSHSRLQRTGNVLLSLTRRHTGPLQQFS
jgi:protoporphyrinogen oxidase